MNEYKDYGLEDICESLDGIETQLKEIINLMKTYLRTVHEVIL